MLAIPKYYDDGGGGGSRVGGGSCLSLHIVHYSLLFRKKTNIMILHIKGLTSRVCQNGSDIMALHGKTKRHGLA